MIQALRLRLKPISLLIEYLGNNKGISFFENLSLKQVRRRVYKTGDEARRDMFDYIEMFDNPKRKHVRNGTLSPVEYERRQKISFEGHLRSRLF